MCCGDGAGGVGGEWGVSCSGNGRLWPKGRREQPFPRGAAPLAAPSRRRDQPLPWAVAIDPPNTERPSPWQPPRGRMSPTSAGPCVSVAAQPPDAPPRGDRGPERRGTQPGPQAGHVASGSQQGGSPPGCPGGGPPPLVPAAGSQPTWELRSLFVRMSGGSERAGVGPAGGTRWPRGRSHKHWTCRGAGARGPSDLGPGP